IDGIRQTWEVVRFYHRTMGAIFTTLTSLEADVRHAENLAISELFNSANVNRKDNVAAQIADLSMKYESQKKTLEIEKLKQEQDLNSAKLQAKDAALEERERTIIYFVLASVVF